MEQVPFLGRKGLEGRVVCGVVCGREGERRGKERRKKRGNESISLYYSPSTPLRGLHPAGIHSPNTLLHTITQPLSIEPRPKNGGSPPSSPPGEREEKEEEKSTYHTYYPQFFSLGENPQTPPSNWDAQEKDKKSEGAR